MAEEFCVVKNERGKANVWRHFGSRKRKSDGTIVDGVAVCFTCHVVLKTGGGTTNLVNHLKRHHPHLLKTKDTKAVKHTSANPGGKIQQTLSAGLFNAPATKYPKDSPQAKAITEQIAIFLAMDLRPYSLVESTHFRRLVRALDPRYTIPSRKHFSDEAVPDLYNRTKAKVVRDLSKVEQVSKCSHS